MGSETGLRIKTLVWFLPPLALVIYLGKPWAHLAAIPMFYLLYREWAGMVVGSKDWHFAFYPPLVAAELFLLAIIFRPGPWPLWAYVALFLAAPLLAFVMFKSRQRLWAAVGVAMLLFPFFAWMEIYDNGPQNHHLFWRLIVTVALADTSAYFGGRALGGIKLVPMLSKGKTWSGFIVALAVGALAYFLLAGIAGAGWRWSFLVWGLVFAAVGHAGDLLESIGKRRFGVKDSGVILPGHGGVMDRLDSHLATAVFAYLVLQFTPFEL